MISLRDFIKSCFILTGVALLPAEVLAQNASLSGRVTSASNETLPGACIRLGAKELGAIADAAGQYEIKNIPAGTYTLQATAIGYDTLRQLVQIAAGSSQKLNIRLEISANQLSDVEVFGVRNSQPQKLDAITRLPLKPSEQIQSISVISERLIGQQGSLTISDVTRNVPGVYTYATYGNMRESISSRGFRGIPVLKNGVRVHSDFRGQGFTTDMQGVESIQVLKGANAITMGVATDLGSPGGIVNIVTKTPRFESGGMASVRTGSWGQFRPAFDFWGPVNAAKTVAFRLNGAYENTGSYRKGVGLEKFYINPSLEWRPDARTSVILEMDYLHDSRTPDAGTVNLSLTENNIYDLDFDRNLGWESNRSLTRNATYTARVRRELNDQFYIRAAFFSSSLETDAITTSMAQFTSRGKDELGRDSTYFVRPSNIVKRSLSRSGRNDRNSVAQFDLVGQNVRTGSLKHTMQIGFDFRSTVVGLPVFANNASTQVVDTVDIFQPVNNTLPADISDFDITGYATTRSVSMGVMAQDVITVNKWLKLFGGVRFSTMETAAEDAAGSTRSRAINPLGGVLVSVKPGLNLFASYTSSTAPATELDKDGNALGNERIDQVEAGIKSEWLNNRLRFNLTLYQINNRNMNLQATEVDAAGVVRFLPYYFKGGNDERRGIETELAGRILPNLEVVAGYAYIQARYLEHTTFVEGSAPNNTPNHTANLWASYQLRRGALQGLSLSAGAYYIGNRPNNDWTQAGTNYHGIVPMTAPWEMESYTTVNAQLAYQYKGYGIRILANNLLNEVGYNAYRTSFINRIDPRNFALVLSYRF